MTRRHVIVGMGAAGIAAAETLLRQDPSADILLVSEDPHGYYSRPGLAYYLTGEISEEWLFPFRREQFEQLNLRQLQAQVMCLHPRAHLIELADGRRLPYDCLLLATGSLAAPFPLPGAGLRGVVKLDDLEDARLILKLVRKARAAVVVGGGITALEIVEGLRARRVRTHYLIRQDRYWSGVLDETESRIVEARLKEEGVRIHYHSEIAEIVGRRGRVEGVRTREGREIPCDIVAVAIGVRPRKELAESAGLATDRGILVDEWLCTSEPDIFAAGDVAQVYDPMTGRAVVDTLWGVALAQGRAAAHNMAGDAVPYHKAVPFNVTRLAGLTTTIIGTVGRGSDADLLGIARGDSETWRQLPDVLAAQEDFEVNRLRMLIGEQRLVGAIVMGDQTLSRPLHHLVSHGVNITPIRGQLLQPDAPLADLVVRFWADWKKDVAI